MHGYSTFYLVLMALNFRLASKTFVWLILLENVFRA
ncbi:MAG: hypothetical protein ACI9VT_001707, partial [Psychroserpens sp.]